MVHGKLQVPTIANKTMPHEIKPYPHIQEQPKATAKSESGPITMEMESVLAVARNVVP
jgi:hypothetical protein